MKRKCDTGLSLVGLQREDLLRLQRQTTDLLNAELNAIVQQVPVEVWHLIFMALELVFNPSVVFRLGCVCHQWSRLCDDLVVRELYHTEPACSDRVLMRFTALTELTLSFGHRHNITNRSVERLTNLTSLNLNYNECVTGDAIRFPEKLRVLGLASNEQFFNPCLVRMTNLVALDLRNNRYICSSSVRKLQSLSFINLDSNHRITLDDLSALPNLTSLDLTRNTKIRDVSTLTQLTTLILDANQRIDDHSLSSLTRLSCLSLAYNRTIGDTGLRSLTNLTALSLKNNVTITDAGLSTLTGLTRLNLKRNRKITGGALTGLSRLTELNIVDTQILPQDLAPLVNLRVLRHVIPDFIFSGPA